MLPGSSAYPTIYDDSSWDSIYIPRDDPNAAPDDDDDEFEFAWFGVPAASREDAVQADIRDEVAADMVLSARNVRFLAVRDRARRARVLRNRGRVRRARTSDMLLTPRHPSSRSQPSQPSPPPISHPTSPPISHPTPPPPSTTQTQTQTHDIDPNVYEELLQLDESNVTVGLSPSEITDKIRKVMFPHSNIYDTSCTICLDDFLDIDTVWALPCSHGFHPSCASIHFSSSVLCPNCRSDIRL